MKYTVVFDQNLSVFETMVDDLLKDGWRPCGRICVLHHRDGAMYYQAMTREDQNE